MRTSIPIGRQRMLRGLHKAAIGLIWADLLPIFRAEGDMIFAP